MDQQWPALLLQGLQNKQLAELISVGLTQKSLDSVIKDVEQFCFNNPSLSDDQIYQLRLVLDTLRACDGKVLLAQELLLPSVVGGKVSFTEAVFGYYSKRMHGTATSLGDDDSKTLRSLLFQAAPTAVVAGLVASKSIKIPEEVRTLVSTILEQMAKKDIDVSKDSIARLFDELPTNTPVSYQKKKLGYQCIATIQRLRTVIIDPLNLSTLIEKHIASAYDIASGDEDQFVRLVAGDTTAEGSGISSADAHAIWKQASVINLRNERVWADIILQREDIPVLAFDQVSPEELDGELPANLATLFQENDSIDVNEYNSVLSPAAYLVDLLQLLRYSYPDSKTLPDPERQSNLLSVFMDRRPDIEKIQLSEANTTTVVKYSNLVNEVLESYVSHKWGEEIKVNNEPENDGDGIQSGRTIPASFSTDWRIYEDILQHQQYPPKYFPFNLAQEAAREYFQALGTPLYDLYNIFQPHMTFGNGWINSKVESSVARRLGAEYLNLGVEDFIMICGEAYQSPTSLSEMKDHRTVMTAAGYAARVGKASTGEYWGYKSTEKFSADDQMIGKDPKVKGLADIKGILLPRSGLAYTELVAILKTEFMAKRFVIGVENDRGLYSGKLEDMRLRSVSYGDGAVGVDEHLSVSSCTALLSFIKLWKKLGWSLRETDAALVTLASNNLSLVPVTEPRFQITAEDIGSLATVKQLSDLTDVEIDRLLPLWGTMRCDAPESLYRRLFCSSVLVKQYPALRTAISSAQDLTGPSMGNLLAPMLSVLGISPDDCQEVFRQLGLDNQSLWSIDNVTKVYRQVQLCRILEIRIKQYESWLVLNDDVVEPLANPRTTLGVIKRWRDLTAEVFTGDLLLQIGQLKLSNGSSLEVPSKAKITTRDILSIIQSCENKYKDYANPILPEDESTIFSTENLVSVLSEIFDVGVVDKIQRMVEGNWSVALPLSKPLDISGNQNLATKVTYGSGSLSIRGVLSETEFQELLDLVPNDKDAVRKLHQEALVPKIVLEQKLQLDLEKSVPSLLSPLIASDPVQVETERISRRKVFLQLVFQGIRTIATTEALTTKVLTAIPTMDPRLAPLLLNSTNASGSTSLDRLRSLKDSNNFSAGDANRSFQGYLSVTTSDTYNFSAVNGASYTIYDNAKTYHFADGFSKQLVLNEGQLVPVTVLKGSGFQGVRITTSAGILVDPSASLFINKSTTEDVSVILTRLSIASTIIGKLKLSEGEVAHFLSRGINMLDLSLNDLEGLVAHSSARDLFRPRAHQTLLEFYRWCSDPTGNIADQEAISLQTASATGLARDDVLNILLAWPNMASDPSILSARVLLHIHEALSLTKKVPVPFQLLKEWCILKAPKDVSTLYETAKSLELVIGTRSDSKSLQACETISRKKRDALVQYLMLQPEIGNMKIVDTDTLFEYFLIDVQMGPEQQTSRIKQAISTVQLFIQRCLLGLEKRNGIATTAVKRSAWAWMSKFTHWQANRKVFLYPENWVQESLRDDKSQQFKTIEAVVLQSNLNLETINSVIRQYIYDVNEIADLQIQAYYWQPGDGFQGKYHLFARTRTAPYKYYHRILQVTGMDVAKQQYKWYPWFKLDVEIPAHEVEFDGKSLDRPGTYLVPALYRGRLFLFIPQILLKLRPKKAPADATFESLREAKINDIPNEQYWEIRMGWVENRNGQWSKKEVSLASIDVEGRKASTGDPTPFPIEATSLPSIASFQFRISSRLAPGTAQAGDIQEREILIIDVYRWFANSKSEYLQLHIGRFELRGTQMVVSDERATNANWKRTIPTKFSQLRMTSKSTTNTALKMELGPYYQYNVDAAKAEQPMVALAPFTSKAEQAITWTVSYDEMQHSGASALVIERAAGSYVDSYFGIPVRNVKGGFSNDTREVITVQQLTHHVSQPLMEVATRTEKLESIFQTLGRVPARLASDAFGISDNGIATELATPYSIYNWELGFHLVLLLMERLFVTQQFELALQVASTVFDPRANDAESVDLDGTVLSTASSTTEHKPLSNLDKCWRFSPFQNSKLRLAGSTKSVVEKLKRGPRTSDAINDWLANPFSAHSVARSRPAIYMKRFIITYIEILIAAGDSYFREDTLESLPLALQYYVEASQLFGPKPETIPRPTKPVVKTYSDIRADMNDFASAAVDMELDYPFFVEPSSRAEIQENSKPHSAVLGMVRSSYFGVPANPQIVGLRDLIDDRFFKIRNSLDINGNFRRLALFEPPIDPLQLIRTAALGDISSSPGNFVEGPTPSYRFAFLLQKAFEIVAELKALGDAYLAIKEKRDAEALAALRSKQDVTMNSLLLRSKTLQREEAVKAMQGLENSRKSQLMRLRYYLALTGESMDKVPEAGAEWREIEQSIAKPTTEDELVMSPNEAMEMIKLDEAELLSDVATAVENTCAVLKALPEFVVETQPMGVGAATQFDPSKIAEGMLLAASVIHQEAGARSSEASRAARKANLIRQLQDRRLQANQAGYDIVNTNIQIQSQEIRLAMCDADIKVQEQQITHVTEMDDYLRTKYTNEALYSWMDASARQILYQTYLLAMDAARSAERALGFELGPKANGSAARLATNYWDAGHQGVFAAHNMYLDLKRIENLYLTRRPHDYEISKNVSLRSVDPWALLRLQEKGQTEFALPEILFDFDFPGHYCRRIKSIQLTIPCLVGPYASVSCTLKLQEHGYRLRQNLSGAPYYPAGSIDLDTRYRTDKIAVSSVAMSNGQRDAGVFELSFSGSNQYGPFEGAGAVSRWSLELPTAVRQFDYRTISDVIMHVNYTSLEGGAVWQKAASDAVVEFRDSVEGRMHTALFDLQNSFLFSNRANLPPQAEVRDVGQQLPFWTRGKTVTAMQMWVVASKGAGLLGAGTPEDVPKINGHETTSISLADEAAKSGNIDILQGLDDVLDVVWMNQATLLEETTTLKVDIPGLKAVIEAKGAKGLRETRLWLLVRYELS